MFKMFKYFVTLLFALTLLGKSLTELPCGDWTAYKDEKCFKVFDNLSMESDAESVCTKKDNESILAIIRDSEEQEFINKYLKASKIADDVWIGIKKTNKLFKWLDETDLKYTNWAKDRPLKNPTDQNCVDMSMDEANFGKWFDDKCGKKLAILCQKVQPWSVPRLQNILLETRRVLIEENKELKTKINKLESNPVPIGFIYVQLSQQSDPKTLWPNTEWENISAKYSGLFFRAEGGQSSAFGSIQEQQTQNISIYSNKCDDNYNIGTPRYIEISYNDKYVYTGNGGGAHPAGSEYGIRMKHNNEEIRPRNQAVRIWQRTK